LIALDIPLLTGHFLEPLARAMGVQHNISDEALKLLLAYEWRGTSVSWKAA